MSKELYINSTRNPRFLDWKKLVSQSGARRQQGRYLVEGLRLVEDAFSAGAGMQALLLDEKFASTTAGKKLGKMAEAWDVEKVILEEGFLGKLTGSPASQGVAALLSLPEQADLEKIAAEEKVLLVSCHGVQDPGNLGAIFRSAAAAGAQGILVDDKCADPLSPKVARAAAGAVWRLPWRQEKKPLELLKALEKKGVRCFAMVAREGENYLESDFTDSSCLMIGSEGQGLSNELKRFSHFRITIPLQKGMESLNAGHSAAVMLFEAARQRKPLK